MDNRTVHKDLRINFEVHDNWTQLLGGTRYLLDLISNRNENKVISSDLLRLVIVSCSQMTEVMFFQQLEKLAKNKSDDAFMLFQYDLKNRITFSEAMRKWPGILTSQPLDKSSEPMQSMDVLRGLRNLAIHHTAKTPGTNSQIGESAFFTAIESSKYFYEKLENSTWAESEYYKFTLKYAPQTDVHISSLKLV